VSTAASSFLLINGRQIETAVWKAQDSLGTIVLLHEALGSVAYWKDFPDKLALATNYDVVAYSRAGHGQSDGPVDARTLEYYENEIEIVLPAVLDHYRVEQPVLYGHSEGAAIAFLYASRRTSVQSVVAECPIFVQEDRTVETIRELEANYPTSDLSSRLGRYHRDADAVFQAWMRSNRSSLFTDFPMHKYLALVRCPVLVLQGARDEFGSIIQFEMIAKILPSTNHVLLDAGHLLHREQPEAVAEHVSNFLSSNLQTGFQNNLLRG